MRDAARHKVVIVQPVHEDGERLLEAEPDLEVVRPVGAGAAALGSVIGDAEAILLRATPLTPELLAGAPRLRMVSRHGVGLDNVPLDLCARRGIVVTHVGDVNAVAVAEHTMALMLAAAKRIVPYDRAVRTGDYDIRASLGAFELAGKTLLLLGLGRIGREVARLGAAFRMRCLAFDPGLGPEAIRALGCEPASDWRDALPEADVLTLHLPLRPETRMILGAGALARMKPGAIVINCARGGLIDEDALAAALSRGALAGAGLDVTEREPPVPEHPLLASDRVVLSPHSAALTRECAMRMSLQAARNIVDFFGGRLDPALIASEHGPAVAAATEGAT